MYRPLFARLLLSATCFGALITDAPAWAQADPPQLSLRADANEVERGGRVTLTLTALGNGSSGQPTSPMFTPPPGWSSQGPTVSSQNQVSIINGHITQKSGFSAAWQLIPQREGDFNLGPVTVMWNGKRLSAGVAHVLVRPPGTHPRSSAQRSQPFFDPFGGLFPQLPDLDEDTHPAPPQPESSSHEPPLSLDAPLEPTAFLRTFIDKTNAVVGEQITFSIYLYTLPRAFQMQDTHEPSAVDFFQRTLFSATGSDSEVHTVSLGGVLWHAQLLRRLALFPLHAGALPVGPMTITLFAPGLHGSGNRGGIVRASKPVTIPVTDPPKEGRPADYTIGDVGSYTLNATVEPRSAAAGDSIAVTAVLRGIGQVPTALRIPEQRGVTWLEPEVHESLDADKEYRIAGSRTFTYIVKLNEPGKIDLGALAVPFWNPDHHTYEVAKATLGAVEATGSAPSAAPSISAARDPFATLAPARMVLSAYAPSQQPWTDTRWFWLALFGGPLCVLAVEGANRAWRLAHATRTARLASPHRRVEQALADAHQAEESRDGKTAASAVERALVLAVEGATGVNLRGLLREEVCGTLEKAGLPRQLAEGIVALLRTCDTWRFEPGTTPTSTSPVAAARDLVKMLEKARAKRS